MSLLITCAGAITDSEINVVAVFPPDQLVSVPGGTASFNCYSLNPGGDTILSTSWLVNGTLFDTLDLGEDVTARFNEEFQIGKLDFDNLPLSYNGTRIQCMATFSSGYNLTSTGATLLLIQGLFKVHTDKGVSTRQRRGGA